MLAWSSLETKHTLIRHQPEAAWENSRTATTRCRRKIPGIEPHQEGRMCAHETWPAPFDFIARQCLMPLTWTLLDQAMDMNMSQGNFFSIASFLLASDLASPAFSVHLIRLHFLRDTQANFFSR